MENCKRILHIRNMEDYYGFGVIVHVIALCFFTYLSLHGIQMQISAHILALLCISVNTVQVFTLFKRHKCAFIFCECGNSHNWKYRILLFTSILENLIYAVFLFVHLMLFMEALFFNAMLYTFLHFLYAVAIGSFFGNYLSGWKSLMPIVLFYVTCLYQGGWWTTDEPTRFCSPTIQLYNVNKIQITNSAALLIITITLFGFLKWEMGRKHRYIIIKNVAILCVCIFTVCLLIMREVKFNQETEKMSYSQIVIGGKNVEYKEVDKDDVLTFISLLTDMEAEVQELAFLNCGINSYKINRYYISGFYFLYQKRPIPIIKENCSISINIFSDAMINFREEELLYDMLNRMFDQMLYEELELADKYSYQLIEGCREQVLRTVVSKNKGIYSDELIQRIDKMIDKSSNIPINENNFLKKLSGHIYENNKKVIPDFYLILKENTIESSEEIINIFTENFSDLAEDKDIQKIIHHIKGEI